MNELVNEMTNRSTSTTARARRVDMVVHTHWDREWYLTREATLARAAAVMAQVLLMLEDGRLPSFLFDGQTAAFRDMLHASEPALAMRLLVQVQRGRIVLGPWYVMADEFLVGGESLLRNLELGLRDAAQFSGQAAGPGNVHGDHGSHHGAVQRIGYLPDSFGHVAQMPQLLRQFDIREAVLWRGADAGNNLFDWQAPNGSVATTVFLPEGYCLHPLNGPDWHEQLPPLLHKLAARTPQGPLLLMHGGDHLAPHPNLADRIAAFNTRQSEWHVVQTTLAGHLQAARMTSLPRQRLVGELRHNTQAFVLPDVLSTRRYLKLAHQALEDRLLGETEPLLARFWPTNGAKHSPHASAYPSHTLERAWRLLIEQQAHDSICGCSLDAVHAEMQQRFVLLGQQLDALRQSALVVAGAITLHRHCPDNTPAGLDVFADDGQCTLFNPLPQQRSGWWVVTLFLRGDAPAALQIVNASGGTLKNEILGATPHHELVSPLDDFPDPVIGHQVEVALWADLPGLSALQLKVSAAQTLAAANGVSVVVASVPAVAVDHINNAAWHVGLDGAGQLCLTDKLRDHSTPLAPCFLSELDAGDSYNFSPPALALATATATTVWRLVHGRRSANAASAQELLLRLEMTVPAGLSADRQGRSADSVTNHGTLRLRLLGDEPGLHAQLTWHNRAQDQRTRLLLPWPQDAAGAASAIAHSDTAFDWSERTLQFAQIPPAPSRSEMPVAVHPSHSAISAGPWFVAHRAMPEFEHVQHAGQSWLGLTLVRSVGWLSRRDLRTRGVGAGPDIATPGAQCIGTQVFDFALQAHAADAPSHAALQAAAILRRPPLLLRGHAAMPWAPVNINNTVLQTSAVRRSADGALELRVWNPTAQPQALALDASKWRAVWADGRDAGGGGTGGAGISGTDADDSSQAATATRYVVPPQAMLTLRELP
jgi:mannosylglycerate hydrolase